MVGPPLLVEPGSSAVLQLYVKADLPPAALTAATTSTATPVVSLDGDLVWEGRTGAGTWIALELVGDDTRALHQSGFVRLRVPGSSFPASSRATPTPSRLLDPRARHEHHARDPRHSLPDPQRRARPAVAYVRRRAPGPGQRRHPQPDARGAARADPDRSHPAGGRRGQPARNRRRPGWTPWCQVDDLATQEACGQVSVGGSPLPVFVVGDDDASVQFGDGLDGLIPVRGPNNLRITYRLGGGAQGNVGAGKLSLDSSLPNVNGIVQREAAVGGTDEESVDDAKRSAPGRLRALERAVTAADFEVLAREKAALFARRRSTAGTRLYPGCR